MRVRQSRLLRSSFVALLILLVGVPTEVAGIGLGSADLRARSPVDTSSAVRTTATEKVTLDDIGTVKLGKTHAVARATVGEADLTCRLIVKYLDGNADSPDDIVSDAGGVCNIYFDVTDSSEAIGSATAKLE
jgi:hypothetical protein